MRTAQLVALALCAAVPIGASVAQTVDQLANDPVPQINGAKFKLVDDPGVEGGKAIRINVPRKGTNVWDSAVESLVNKPVKAGDRLVLYFDARLEKGAGDAVSAPIPFTAIQMSSAPYSPVIQGNVTLTPEWRMHKIEGKADKDYPAGALKAAIHLGNAKQTVDFGPVVVLNMGQ